MSEDRPTVACNFLLNSFCRIVKAPTIVTLISFELLQRLVEHHATTIDLSNIVVLCTAVYFFANKLCNEDTGGYVCVYMCVCSV